MAIDRITRSRWFVALLQLALFSLGLVFLFAVVYWSMDALNWGVLQSRTQERATGFLSFLYFSVETFFRIGCGDQTPVGAMWAVVTVEALSHFLIEVLFIAQFATLSLSKVISLSDRTRLENTLKRF